MENNINFSDIRKEENMLHQEVIGGETVNCYKLVDGNFKYYAWNVYINGLEYGTFIIKNQEDDKEMITVLTSNAAHSIEAIKEKNGN